MPATVVDAEDDEVAAWDGRADDAEDAEDAEASVGGGLYVGKNGFVEEYCTLYEGPIVLP